MYLERMHDIMPQEIHVVTSFCNIGEVPALRTVRKMEMAKLTSSTSDSRGMIVNPIKDDLVKYSYMVIGYKKFLANRINSVSATTVNAAYRMIKEDASFDLCTSM